MSADKGITGLPASWNSIAASLRIGWILSAVSVSLLMAPALIAYSPIVPDKFGAFVLIGLGLVGGAIFGGASAAKVSAAIFRGSHERRALVAASVLLLAIVLPVTLAAVYVWVRGEASSLYWYIVYIAFFSGAIVVAAHAVLLYASTTWRRTLRWPALLSVFGFAGAIALSFLSTSVAESFALLTFGLTVMTIGCDVAAGVWATGARGHAAQTSGDRARG